MALGQRARTGSTSAPIEPAVWALAVAAGVELAILRTFTRTAVHIPGLQALRTPYEILTKGGEFAYFLTLCLLLPVGVGLVVALYRERHPQRYLASFGLSLFALPWPLLDAHAISTRAMDALTLGAVAALASAIVLTARRAARLPVITFALAFGASALYTLAMTSGSVHGFQHAGTLLSAAELLGLAYGCSTPLMVDRSADRLATTAGVASGVLVLAAMLGNGSTSRFLLLWNAGLSGTFPSFIYAAAAGALVYTILRGLRSGAPLLAAGLVLLVAGGLGLHSTYQSGLVVAGLASLALALWSERVPDGSSLMHEAAAA